MDFPMVKELWCGFQEVLSLVMALLEIFTYLFQLLWQYAKPFLKRDCRTYVEPSCFKEARIQEPKGTIETQVTSTQTDSEYETAELIHLNLLSSSINKMLQKDTLTDVTLNCENREFRAHRVILAAVNPYFRSMFTHPGKKPKKLYMPTISAERMATFLSFVYNGQIFETVMDIDELGLKYSNRFSDNAAVDTSPRNIQVATLDRQSDSEVDDDFGLREIQDSQTIDTTSLEMRLLSEEESGVNTMQSVADLIHGSISNLAVVRDNFFTDYDEEDDDDSNSLHETSGSQVKEMGEREQRENFHITCNFAIDSVQVSEMTVMTKLTDLKKVTVNDAATPVINDSHLHVLETGMNPALVHYGECQKNRDTHDDMHGDGDIRDDGNKPIGDMRNDGNTHDDGDTSHGGDMHGDGDIPDDGNKPIGDMRDDGNTHDDGDTSHGGDTHGDGDICDDGNKPIGDMRDDGNTHDDGDTCHGGDTHGVGNMHEGGDTAITRNDALSQEECVAPEITTPVNIRTNAKTHKTKGKEEFTMISGYQPHLDDITATDDMKTFLVASRFPWRDSTTAKIKQLPKEADFLQIDGLFYKALEEKYLTATNFKEMYDFFEKLHNAYARDRIVAYLAEHFKEASKSDDFSLLKTNQMRGIVQYMSTAKMSKKDAVTGILRWMESGSDRTLLLDDFLAILDLHKCSECLNDVVNDLISSKATGSKNESPSVGLLVTRMISMTAAENTTHKQKLCFFEYNTELEQVVTVVYDWKKNRHLTIRELPGPAYHGGLTVAVYKNHVYYFGISFGTKGTPATTKIVSYCPATKCIEEVEKGLVHAVSYAGVGILDDVLYVVNGIGKTHSIVNTVQRYNSMYRTCLPVAPTNNGYISPHVLPYNSSLYVVGSWGATNNYIEHYNPVDDQWTTLTQVPGSSARCYAGLCNRKLVVVSREGSPQMQVYDLVFDSWVVREFLGGPEEVTGLWSVTKKDECVLIVRGDQRLFSYGVTSGHWEQL